MPVKFDYLLGLLRLKDITDISGDVTQAQLDAEIAAREAADDILQDNIDAEATTRANADNSEATTRANADTTLQNNINTEAASRASADTTLQNNINSEASTRSAADVVLAGRATVLENNVLKTSYFASISAASGTITKPTGSTIILADFPSGIDAVVETIVNGQPSGTEPVTAGGAFITVASIDVNGNYILSGTPSAYPVALIYIISIKEIDKGNLTFNNIVGIPVVVNGASIAYADAKVADAINDGVTTIAPSQNAVFDALALKQNSLGFTAENVANKDTDVTMAANSDTKYPSQKAVKTYIDNSINDFDIKLAVRAASQGNLSFTRSGNVYTASGVGVLLKATIDSGWSTGSALSVGDRILLANQTSNVDNGIVTITSLGAIGLQAVLTRSTDMDADAEVTSEMRVPVAEGTDANIDYKLSSAGPFTLNTTALPFTKAGGPPTGSAGGDLTGTYPNPTIKSSVSLPGAPTVSTPAASSNDTTVVNSAFVTTAITNGANPSIKIFNYQNFS